MKSVTINNIPSANRKKFGFKGINSSEAHNDNQNEMLNDILDLFNKVNAVERVVNENLDFIKYENTNLEVMNAMLLKKFEQLSLDYNDILKDNMVRKITIHPESCTVFDKQLGAIIDKRTSSITARPSKKISKFAIFDEISDSIFLPDTLNVSILGSNRGIISQADNDIYAPFYKDNNLYWTRRSLTDNTVEEVQAEYIITLPEDIMTTTEMNEIYINPFMCKVIDVQVRYGDSTSWESVTGIDFNPAVNNDSTLEGYIKSYRPIGLSFPNKKVNQIKIIVRCDNYIEGETNIRTFMYGIKEIGGYINYYSNYENSSFQFDVTIPDTFKYVITGIKPYFNNGSEFGNYSRDFSYEIYYKDSAGDYHKITDNFPFTPSTNDLRIKCKFGERYDEINIRKIEVVYKKLTS